MKIFIVNLKQAVDKRCYMEAQLNQLQIKNYEFIDAIYGKDLSENYISTHVYDYPTCALSLGEIGCALSHLKIYQKMVEDSIPYALILEDDVNLPEDIKDFLEAITASINSKKSKVITLGYGNKITLLHKYFNYKNYGEYTAVTAFGTYVYLINLAAAHSLSQHLLPIKYEADMFIHFRENGWLDQFNIIYPQYVYVMDNHHSFSNIYLERKPLKLARHRYKKYQLLKKRPWWLRLKNRLKRLYWRIGQIKPKKTQEL